MLHNCNAVSELVHIVVLPPCWATLHPLDRSCVWIWDMEFRVLLDCQILTPPPHVLVQLPQEPHSAQVASTARGDICQFSWAIKRSERNNPLAKKRIIHYKKKLTAGIGIAWSWSCLCNCTDCWASTILGCVTISWSALRLNGRQFEIKSEIYQLSFLTYPSATGFATTAPWAPGGPSGVFT